MPPRIPPPESDYQPGDRIITRLNGGKERAYVVQDPPRTSRGKLRVRREGSNAVNPTTTWWTPQSPPPRLARIEPAGTCKRPPHAQLPKSSYRAWVWERHSFLTEAIDAIGVRETPPTDAELAASFLRWREVIGTEVTDEMVERAHAAYHAARQRDGRFVAQREAMRKALVAAVGI